MSKLLTDNARSLLSERYQEDGETPDHIWSRCSGGNEEYRRMLAELMFMPNSPTLFNMGTKSGGTSSACFVFDIEDTLLGDWPLGGLAEPFISSIAGTAFKAMCVAKAGGGVGYYLGNIRPEGSVVNSTHKKACGIVPVILYLNEIRSLITQGGKRDLAQIGITPIWHADARKVIHCKDSDPQRLSSFNLSMGWPNEWVRKAFEQDGLERELWQEQCESAWKTGCPGMWFEDTVNRWNATPHLGRINAPNPCGETPNLSDEPCNLGSMALLRMVDKDTRKIRWDAISHYAQLGTRYLDDVLDWNVFPHPDITKMARATRKLGLGVMGWADILAVLRIPYDTTDAVELGRELYKTIRNECRKVSMELARTKDIYPAYDPEKSPQWAPASRNSTNTSIAPTGSISIIVGCEPSIEPHYAYERERTTYEGIKFKENIFDWLGDLGDFKPKVSHEIAPEWHVRHQAAFQESADLGVSKTVNLPNSATVQDVSNIYKMMYDLNCKGGTIFRDGCRKEQVLVAKKASVYALADQPVVAKLPDDVEQLPRHKVRIGGTKCYIHVGVTPDKKRPLEVFLRVKNAGSAMGGMLDAFAIELSLALQRGTPLEQIVELHAGSRFEPAGMTSNKDIPVCTSIPDYLVRYLYKLFNGKDEEATGSGMFCPECTAELIMQAGCLTCLKCAYSRCG